MYIFSPAGQSLWSSLVLVAACCPSVGESSPAHHPGHDLPQRPPNCHPQGSHLRYTQEAAVTGWPLETQTGTSWASMQFSDSFINLFDHSFVHLVTHWLTDWLNNTCLLIHLHAHSCISSSDAHVLLHASCSLAEHMCLFCWERQVGGGAAMKAFLVPSPHQQPSLINSSWINYNASPNEWPLTSCSLLRQR